MEATVAGIRSELERLGSEVAALRARVAELEAALRAGASRRASGPRAAAEVTAPPAPPPPTTAGVASAFAAPAGS